VEYLRHVLSSEEVSKTLKKTTTELLKKNRFNWNKDAQIAFEKLKTALCKAPILE
jgi:hypothetical protein